MFKKHIIFQILYIIVGPLCPAFLKRLIFYKRPSMSHRDIDMWGMFEWAILGGRVLTFIKNISLVLRL